MIIRMATPPTIPPAMAPVCVLWGALFSSSVVGVGAGEELVVGLDGLGPLVFPTVLLLTEPEAPLVPAATSSEGVNTI